MVLPDPSLWGPNPGVGSDQRPRASRRISLPEVVLCSLKGLKQEGGISLPLKQPSTNDCQELGYKYPGPLIPQMGRSAECFLTLLSTLSPWEPSLPCLIHLPSESLLPL